MLVCHAGNNTTASTLTIPSLMSTLPELGRH
jgi:hypothetical protein